MDTQKIAQLTLERGGLTLRHDLSEETERQTGYYVSVSGFEVRLPIQVVANAANGIKSTMVETVVGWLANAAWSRSQCYVGTWEDAETGQVCFDLTEWFEHAYDARLAGVGRGQKAIYDIAAGKSIVLEP